MSKPEPVPVPSPAPVALPPPTWIPQDGPCAYCKLMKADPEKHCDDCKRAIPVYTGMGGSGYESATVHHYHLESASALTMRIPIMRELCAECYRADYQRQFPGAADPV